MTTGDNQCQRMKTSDTTSDKEWQRVVQDMKWNESKWEHVKEVILGFKMKQGSNLVLEDFYSCFLCDIDCRKQYRLFTNRETDEIFFQYNVLCFYHAGISSFSGYQFCWNLLKHFKLIV